MSGSTSGMDRSQGWRSADKRTVDRLWSLGLLIAAIALFTVNLGGVALRDWDEGLVAQVAKEIAQSPLASLTWLYPTLWQAPYLNKPPLVHDLIAIAFAIGGIHEWTARLPGALLTALSVPLFFSMSRELFHRRSPAVFAALVYLTSIPVVRNGRLAMLDGALLCFAIAMIGCLLRARRNRHYAYGVGLGLALIALTKGVMVALLLGAIALLFLLWDTPRLLSSRYFWLRVGLGSLPAILWYGAQAVHYGDVFWNNNLVEQSFQRIWTDVEQNSGPPWFYALELVKYGVPWLLFLPLGCRLGWTNRSLSWAKLAIVWASVYAAAISLMATKLPWYSLPLYPALALLVGAQLSELWQRGRFTGVKTSASPAYDRLWIGWFAILALVSWAAAFYYGQWSVPLEPDLQWIFTALAATMTAVAVLLLRQDAQFAAVLVWGTYLSLMLLMSSNHWVWELAEAYPVKPVAALIQQHSPAAQKIYTSDAVRRPSLEFYSDRPVIPASWPQLKRLWQRRSPYFLLDRSALTQLQLQPEKSLGTAEGWTLITKDR